LRQLVVRFFLWQFFLLLRRQFVVLWQLVVLQQQFVVLRQFLLMAAS
jgi:hypothetical protein